MDKYLAVIARYILMRVRSGVYQIVNEINGHFYVGSSKNIDFRWAKHRYDAKKPPKYRSILRAAMQRYGIENFTFIVLEECEPVKEMLLEREQYYLDLWRPAYNILSQAGSRLGSIGPHSAETIEKIRMAHLADHVREAHSKYQKAKMADPANREQISDKMKQHRAVVGNQGASIVGTKRSEDTKRNISEALRSSEKKLASYERQKGKTIPNVSISGEYAVTWRRDIGRWTVRIANKKYGCFKTIEEAVARRDMVLATR